jgi:hypothetical protein
MTIEQARERFPIGTEVKYFPVKEEEAFHVAKVLSEPWSAGSGHLLIIISGRAGGVSVNHLEAFPESTPTVRASDGRPDDPFNGQCPVDEVAKKYRGAA